MKSYYWKKKRKGPFDEPSLKSKGENDMFPLHIACSENLEENIIRRVFDKEIATRTDLFGMTPLHYASDHKDAQHNIIKMLIEKDSAKDIPTRISPLLVAVIADAPDSVLQELMEPKYFNLTGFSDSLILDLSLRVKANTELKKRVNWKLAQRWPFWLLYTDLVIKIMAFASFMIWSEFKSSPRVRNISLGAVFICSVFLTFREIVQLFSQRVEYFLKTEKVIEIVTICCMAFSLRNISKATNMKGKFNDSDTYLFVFTVIFLATLILFSLRSTFLPFAKFVGGVNTIFYILFPFFVVATLVLLTFAYIYRMRYSLAGISDDDQSDAKEYCRQDKAFHNCFSLILHGFFHGFEEPSSSIDIVFGVFVILVLLTVVIAIVGEGWDESQKRAIVVYWHGRLSFLSEIQHSIDIDLSRYAPLWIVKLYEKIIQHAQSTFL